MPPRLISEIYPTAFVSGASTGLGRAFTDMLIADGVRVTGTSRDVRRLDEVVATHGAKFTALALDLRSGPAAEQAFVQAQAGREFDLVINNAGYGVFGQFAAVEFENWREQMEVMLINTARLSHAALRSMLARNSGALVNISSLAAEFPLPFQSAYNVTKAGLSALNESLMLETAGTGVVVLDVRPGDYRTDFETSVRRPPGVTTPRMARAWAAFEAMMRTGPHPAHAARQLRRALLRRRSGTVRTGRAFQTIIGPFLARFGSLPLRRRIQAKYFDVA
jgi:short-subunit dehydrogenase